jgi:hypothetical protein
MRQAGREPERVAIVELFQHLIRQADTVQLPERVVVAVPEI